MQWCTVMLQSLLSPRCLIAHRFSCTMSTLFGSSSGVVRTSMPAKSASAGARKSGASASAGYQQQQQQAGQQQTQQQETKLARKSSGGRMYRDEEHVVHAIAQQSEDENTSPAQSSRSMAVKSSSTASPSLANSSGNNARQLQHANTASSVTTSTDASLPPLVQSRRGGKDNIANIPPGANRPGLGKGKGKGYPAAPGGKSGKLVSYKRKADAAITASSDSIEDDETAARRREETDTEEDQSSSLNVRSRSPRGVSMRLLSAWSDSKAKSAC
jgi:hypothetical protein